MNKVPQKHLPGFMPGIKRGPRINSNVLFIAFLIAITLMGSVLGKLQLNAYRELQRESELQLANLRAWRLYSMLLFAVDDKDRILEYIDEYTCECASSVYVDNVTGDTFSVNNNDYFIDEGELVSFEYADGYALIEGNGFSYYAFYVTADQNAAKLYYCVDSSVIDRPVMNNTISNMLILFVIMGIILVLAYYSNIYRPTKNLWVAMSNLSEGNFDFKLNTEYCYTELAGFSAEVNQMMLKLKHMISQEYYSQLLKKRAELNALQSEINPHFLYNTIDCIRGQALSEKSYDIANIAKTLSAVFRYSVNERNDFVSVEKELMHVKNYMAIQNYRFKDRFELVIEIEKENNTKIMSFSVPKMIIQPLVENAIIHGLEQLSTQGRITVRMVMTQTQLTITVEDNGIGIKQEKLKELNDRFSQKIDPMKELLNTSANSSIALINIHQRIRIIYGDDYGVKLYSTYGVGTQCVLQLGVTTEDNSPCIHPKHSY